MMGKQAVKKLSGSGGETIGETLVALLISSLALLMLAGAVTAAFRIVLASEETISAYNEEDQDLAEQKDGTEDGNINVTIKDADSSTTIKQTYSGKYYSNETFNGINVVAYKAGG